MNTQKIVKPGELRARDVIIEVRPDYSTLGEAKQFLIERPDPQKMYAVQPIARPDSRAVGKVFEAMVTDYLNRGGDVAKLELRVIKNSYTSSGYEVRLFGMEGE